MRGFLRRGHFGNHQPLQGDFIGVDVTGTAAIPNAGDGVEFSDCNTALIGGNSGAAANVLSGNTGNGVNLNGEEETRIVVQGNLIGTDVTGTHSLGNGADGIIIQSAAHQNLIGGTQPGEDNFIAFNTDQGVAVDGTLTFGEVANRNGIFSNSIFSNSPQGIFSYISSERRRLRIESLGPTQCGKFCRPIVFWPTGDGSTTLDET